MVQRDFGPSEFSNIPIKHRNAPLRARSENPYMTQERQSERMIRQARRAYENEFDGYQGAIATMERPELGNDKLPIFAYKEQIVESINDNQLTIIVAETGGGKSTQVPQFLVQAGYRVTHSQPRRLAAREVADRIGNEITEFWTDTPKDISSYHTAEANKITENTIIAQLTDGLLLAQDTGSHGRDVGEMDVTILDEVHEWSKIIEMELAHIRRQMIEYPERRFVIMSATMDVPLIQDFFADVLDGELPPVIEVPGRTFPVEKQEFPDQTVMQRVLLRAREMHDLNVTQRRDDFVGEVMPTGIIITAPGKRDIKDYMDELQANLPPDIAATATIIPLHSKMSDQEQNMAKRTDYPGIKIIVSTDVAKTSVTIPGLAGVIDCGYARHEDLDDGYSDSLVLYATAYADRMQWAGRCGRIAPGWYDLAKMNDDMPYISLDECEPFEQAEMLRTNPIEFVLKVAAMGSDFSDWKFVHTPKADVVAHAKESLRLLGALDEDDKITAVGRRMHEFPMRPPSARMMVEADQYSPRVRTYMAAIVAAQEAGGLPLFTQDNERRWKQLVKDRDSDLIAQLDIFTEVQYANQAKVASYDLDVKNVNRAKETYWKTLVRSNGSRDPLIPPSQEECEQIKSCIYTGMPDGMYQFAGDGEYESLSTRDTKRRTLSNRSVVMGKHQLVAGSRRQIEFYKQGVRETRDILQDITVVDDIRALGQSALKQIERRPTGEIQWHNGRPQVVTRQHLYGIDLGIEEQTEAEATVETQKFLVAHALEHPGFEQKRLRDIKKELERLNHLTQEHVMQLTQDELIGRLRQATPVGQLDPQMTDVNLSLQEVKITDYISDEDRQRILDSAPSSIPTGAGSLTLRYQSGRPIVSKYDLPTVLGFTDDFRLPDGREIYFVHERHEYTLPQLKRLHAR